MFIYWVSIWKTVAEKRYAVVNIRPPLPHRMKHKWIKPPLGHFIAWPQSPGSRVLWSCQSLSGLDHRSSFMPLDGVCAIFLQYWPLQSYLPYKGFAHFWRSAQIPPSPWCPPWWLCKIPLPVFSFLCSISIFLYLFMLLFNFLICLAQWCISLHRLRTLTVAPF